MTPLAATEAERLEREAFEKEYGPRDGFAWRNENGTYKIASLQLAWEIWWKARAMQQTAEPVGWLPRWAADQLSGVMGGSSDWGVDTCVYKGMADRCVPIYLAAPDRAPSTELVLARQIATWRKEVERLQDLIATADGAPSTDSAADARRLDWIEQVIQRQSSFVAMPCGPDMRFVQVRSLGGCTNFPTVSGLRAAIDAAIAASLPQTKEE